ncbi:hypothetical protein [Legionella worsleiensis]|uniref:Periplasmic protein n=1 Tax=Legionella worsleiensis TaxID=45076 RepID=A0A0W1A3X0_9GAMM|nr:hypothetical protein [Legionella worsleiensis]KTD76004.1 periplasmic protein [Legionella worsleiensis]STY33017.1 periplasmic protein [Legionella worsleiensis]
MMRLLTVFCLGFLSAPLWSFKCYYTLVKDSCWTNYEVSVDVMDSAKQDKIFTITVPKGESWGRVEFSCTPAQSLMYFSRYSPVFWESEKGKVYPAIRSWSLPGTINPGDEAWTLNICFSADFSQIPLPPDAKGNCKCDMSAIPAPKP